MKFAVFTDLHHDQVFDGERRIREFLSFAEGEGVSFIVSLGDLCKPIEKNRGISDILGQVKVPVYFAAGNHDLEENTPEEWMNFIGVKSTYSSFSYGNIKFIILDACYMKLGNKIFPYLKSRHLKKADQYPLIPDFEVQWLKREMQREDLYYIIFSHHSLANDFENRGVSNREEIREILSRRKTVLCMNGHDHGEDCKIIRGIPYYTLNSITYLWHGKKDICPFGEDIHQKYPYLSHMILYREPLYCTVEIADGKGTIIGAKSDYWHITPEDVGIPDRKWNNISVQPKALDFEFSLLPL